MPVPVTRDDGVHSESPCPPAGAATPARHDVVAAAPLENRGGTGTGSALALRADGPVQVVPVQVVPVRDEPGGARTPGPDGGAAPAVTSARPAASGKRPRAVAPATGAATDAGRAVLHAATALATGGPLLLRPHRTGHPAEDGTVTVDERPQKLLGPRTATALALERRAARTLLAPLTGAPPHDAPADPTHPRVPGPPAAPDEETG